MLISRAFHFSDFSHLRNSGKRHRAFHEMPHREIFPVHCPWDRAPESDIQFARRIDPVAKLIAPVLRSSVFSLPHLGACTHTQSILSPVKDLFSALFTD